MMTLEQFAGIAQHRIPTPLEFVEFVFSQPGWFITVSPDRKASLRVPKADELAIAVARMMSREPWRTEVIDIVTLRNTA